MIKIADCRLPFASQVAQLRGQQQWLIDLEYLLDPPEQPDQPPLTSQSVAQTVDHYLTELLTKVANGSDKEDQRVAAHINTTFRERWWGLFKCYDVTGLPRTNNELERYMRRIKSGHRRILGRKNVHDFIIRYAFIAAGQLQVVWVYHYAIHRRTTITALANRFVENLQKLGRQVQADGEEVCPLSLLQRVMVAGTLPGSTAGEYVVQWHCMLRGPLDDKVFWQSWQQVKNRHPALRTLLTG